MDLKTSSDVYRSVLVSYLPLYNNVKTAGVTFKIQIWNVWVNAPIIINFPFFWYIADMAGRTFWTLNNFGVAPVNLFTSGQARQIHHPSK